MDVRFAQILIIIELGYRAYGRLLVDTTMKSFSKVLKYRTLEKLCFIGRKVFLKLQSTQFKKNYVSPDEQWSWKDRICVRLGESPNQLSN